MENMSRLIVRMEIAARKAALSRNDDKNLLNQKTKLLFLLMSGSRCPLDLTTELCINKCNLALLTRQLESEDLIVKKRRITDRREITIAITQKGVDSIEQCLATIEDGCKNAFGGGYDEANEKLLSAIEVLDFI